MISVSGPSEIKLDDLTDVDKFSSAEPNIIYGLIRKNYGSSYEPSEIIIEPPPLIPGIYGSYLFSISDTLQIVIAESVKFQTTVSFGTNISKINDTTFVLAGGHAYDILFTITDASSPVIDNIIDFSIFKIVGGGVLKSTGLRTSSVSAIILNYMPTSTLRGFVDNRNSPSMSISINVGNSSGQTHILSSSILIKQVLE